MNPQEMMMQQLLANHPQAAAMAQMMQQNQETTSDDTLKTEELIADNKKLIKALKAAQANAKQLLQVIQDLQEELDEVYELTEDYALATGACPECMGMDTQCEQCNGNGSPGSQHPDQQLFQHLIAPALKYQQQITLPNTLGQ